MVMRSEVRAVVTVLAVPVRGLAVAVLVAMVWVLMIY